MALRPSIVAILAVVAIGICGLMSAQLGVYMLPIALAPFIVYAALRFPMHALASLIVLVILIPQGKRGERDPVLDASYILMFGTVALGLARRAATSHASAVYDSMSLWAIAFVAFFLPINLAVALAHDIRFLDWLKYAAPFLHFGLPLLLRNYDITQKDVNRFRDAMILVGMINVGLIVDSFLQGQLDVAGGRYARATGVDQTTVLAVPIALLGFSLAAARQRRIYMITAMAAIAAVFLTQTRGLIVGAGITAAVFFLMTWRDARTRNQLVIAFTLLALGTMLLAMLRPDVFRGIIIARFDQTETNSSITVDSRLEEIDVMMQFVRDSPLFGRGFGETIHLYSSLAPQNYVHNSVFFFAGFAGITGVVAYFGLCGTLGLQLFRLARRTDPLSDDRRFWAATFATFIGMLFYGTTCTIFYALSFNLFLGLFMALVMNRMQFERRAVAERSALG